LKIQKLKIFKKKVDYKWENMRFVFDTGARDNKFEANLCLTQEQGIISLKQICVWHRSKGYVWSKYVWSKFDEKIWQCKDTFINGHYYHKNNSCLTWVTKPKSTQSQFTNQWSANFVGIVELSALCPVNVIIDKRCATITLIVNYH
jgi:hypothetical protein